MARSKKKLGNLILLFKSTSEVKIIDNLYRVKDAGEVEEKLYLVAFPFLFCAKFLFNFPPPWGFATAKTILDRIEKKINSDRVEDCNISLLNICSFEHVSLLEDLATARWTYKAKLLVINKLPELIVNLDNGEEEKLHRTAIDAVFQHSKEKFQELCCKDNECHNEIGALFCIYVQGFIKQLVEDGVEYLPHSYNIALQMTGQMLDKIGGN